MRNRANIVIYNFVVRVLLFLKFDKSRCVLVLFLSTMPWHDMPYIQHKTNGIEAREAIWCFGGLLFVCSFPMARIVFELMVLFGINSPPRNETSASPCSFKKKILGAISSHLSRQFSIGFQTKPMESRRRTWDWASRSLRPHLQVACHFLCTCMEKIHRRVLFCILEAIGTCLPTYKGWLPKQIRRSLGVGYEIEQAALCNIDVVTLPPILQVDYWFLSSCLKQVCHRVHFYILGAIGTCSPICRQDIFDNPPSFLVAPSRTCQRSNPWQARNRNPRHGRGRWRRIYV